MSAEFIIILITVFANVILGLFTYFKNPKSDTNRLFSLLTAIIALWTITNYASLNAANEFWTLFWIRVVMVVTAPIGPVILLLVHTFPSNKIYASKKSLIFLSTLVITTTMVAITPLMFSSVSLGTHGEITPTPEPGIMLYAVTFLGSLAAAFGVIIKKYFKSEGIEKVQLKYLLLGIITTFTLIAITNFIFVIILDISQFVIFGPLFSLILVGFIAYAIVKHRFMDIGLVVARTVSYTLLIALFATIYALAMLILGSIFTETTNDTTTLFFATILSLIMAISFAPLNKKLQQLTDRIFYKGNYETSELLYELALIMSSKSKSISLSKAVIEFLSKKMHTTKERVILEDEGEYKIIQNYEEDSSDDEIEIIRKINKIIIYEELKDSELKTFLKEKGISVVIPLFVNKSKIACIVLSKKKSGDIYSASDIKFFEIIAPQVAIAIQNTVRAENELKQEKQASENKSKFLTVASHRLRTPLSAINWNLEMLSNGDFGKINSKASESISQISANTNKLIKLVNDLLEVQDLDSGNYFFKNKNEKVSVIKIVNNAIKKYSKIIDDKNVSIDIQNEIKNNSTLEINKPKFEKVIQEIISNAATYNKKDGKIIINISIKKRSLTISIQDTGTGIDKSDMEYMFSKFYRGKRALIQDTEGSGIGLFLVKTYIELWHGKVALKSQKGIGTKITIKLPLAN